MAASQIEIDKVPVDFLLQHHKVMRGKPSSRHPTGKLKSTPTSRVIHILDTKKYDDKLIVLKGKPVVSLCYMCLQNDKIVASADNSTDNFYRVHFVGKQGNRTFKVDDDHKEFVENNPSLTRSRTETRGLNDQGELQTFTRMNSTSREAADHLAARVVEEEAASYRLISSKAFREYSYHISNGKYDGPGGGEKSAAKYVKLDATQLRKDIKESIRLAKIFHGGRPFLTIYFDGWTDGQGVHWVRVTATYTEDISLELKSPALGIFEMTLEEPPVPGQPWVVPACSGANFCQLIEEVVYPQYGITPELVVVPLSDNCTKEACGARLMTTHYPAKTCDAHSLALCIGHAYGSKWYKSATRASRNNNEGKALMKRTHALYEHFKKTPAATKGLKLQQIEDLKKSPRPFPFDRPSSSLKKPRR